MPYVAGSSILDNQAKKEGKQNKQIDKKHLQTMEMCYGRNKMGDRKNSKQVTFEIRPDV